MTQVTLSSSPVASRPSTPTPPDSDFASSSSSSFSSSSGYNSRPPSPEFYSASSHPSALPSRAPSPDLPLRLVRVPSSPHLTAAPEDMSMCMRTVWMPDSWGVQRNFLGDMANLAVRYNFTLVVQVGSESTIAECDRSVQRLSGLSDLQMAQHVEFVEAGDAFTGWGEDNKILTVPNAEGQPMVLYPPRVRRWILDTAQAFTREEGFHPYSQAFQGAVSQRNEGEDAHAFAQNVGMRSRCTRSYLEGGNVLTGTLADGKPYALVGRDSQVITTFALRTQRRGHGSEAIATRRAEMQAAGLMGAHEVSTTVRKLRAARGAADYFGDWLHGKAAISQDEAKDWLAEMDLTLDVIAHDLGMPRAQVFAITQPDFHIDMHMRPTNAGELLLNDPRVSVRLLEDVLSKHGYPAWQREELTEMLSRARAEAERDAATCDAIAQELREAGIRCIPAPGVFASDSRDANFMNGIPGRMPDGSTFYFTNASSITPLQNAVETFLRLNTGVQHVEFVGAAGGGPNEANAAEESLTQSGGLDCREVHSSALFSLPGRAA